MPLPGVLVVSSGPFAAGSTSGSRAIHQQSFRGNCEFAVFFPSFIPVLPIARIRSFPVRGDTSTGPDGGPPHHSGERLTEVVITTVGRRKARNFAVVRQPRRGSEDGGWPPHAPEPRGACPPLRHGFGQPPEARRFVRV